MAHMIDETTGRAAIAYFIDDSTIQETRRLFESIASANRKPKLNAPN
jgi:hypothetical protein